MNDPEHHTSVRKLARLWSQETGQEFEVVASILLRWARGDYFETTDPMLPFLLATMHQSTDSLDTTDQSDYLEPDVIQVLKHYDSEINMVELRGFCIAQNIPLPRCFGSVFGAKVTGYERRKEKTRSRNRAIKVKALKLLAKNPRLSNSTLAEKIQNTDAGKELSTRRLREILGEWDRETLE